MKPICPQPPFALSSHPRMTLLAASLLVPLLTACGGGAGSDTASAASSDTANAATRITSVIEEPVEQVAENTLDPQATPVQAPAEAPPADQPLVAGEVVTAKSFAQTDLISTTCLPGVTIAEAVAKLNAARAVGRMCGSTWYPAAPEVKWSEALARAASGHSQDMATQNYFSHTSLDGRSPGTRITAAGYSWNAYGENIAAGQSTMDAAMAAWLPSPGHCKNIMNPRYTDYAIGCAYKSSARYRTYWTQDFAAPRATR